MLVLSGPSELLILLMTVDVVCLLCLLSVSVIWLLNVKVLLGA